MYDDHYGLNGRPFQLTPDPKFWFDTATHKKAMAYLGYGISQGEGFIVITGDPGAGKTTLVGHLTKTIDTEQLHLITIVTTQIEAEDLLHMVASGLGIESEGMVKAHLLAAIERGLHAEARQGRRTLLIVDEAQALPVASLEELRMLSNFQSGGYPLLQIFLLGQPEFRAVLQGHDRLEQLRQRVIAMHHLAPMDPNEVEAYLIHRLSVVGWRGRPRFSTEAIAAMHRWSRGTPRMVNQIAGRVMLHGSIEEIDAFTGADVEAVIEDLENDMNPVPRATAPRVDDTPRAAPVEPPMPDEAEAPIPPVSIFTPERVPEPEPEPEVAFVEPEIEAESEPCFEPEPEPQPEVVPEPVQQANDDAPAASQLDRIEARLDEQDRALRRVLTLLVDWVEGDAARPDLDAIRDSMG